MLVAFALTCIGLGSSTKAFSATDVIYSFAGDEDGEYADTDLALDKAANLYGTTVLEGDFGSGTVFQLSPSPNGWIHTVPWLRTALRDWRKVRPPEVGL